MSNARDEFKMALSIAVTQKVITEEKANEIINTVDKFVLNPDIKKLDEIDDIRNRLKGLGGV